MNRQLDFELDDLPVDVFDLDGGDLSVESLTAGHGITELGASSCTLASCWMCWKFCSCCPQPQ